MKALLIIELILFGLAILIMVCVSFAKPISEEQEKILDEEYKKRKIKLK